MKPTIRLLLFRRSLEAQIRAMFINGEQGVWYDPSDINSMYQDSAGTTAAVVGQPVGKILDKSGRDNHATQATAASRPTLQQDASGYYYLSFDGVDDWMATAAIDFSATDKMTVWAGVNKQSDAATGLVMELSAITDSNNGSFFLAAPRTGAVADYGWRSKGTVVADVQSAASYAAPVSSVIACQGDIAGDASRIKVNGGAAVSVVTDQGTGNYGNYPLYIGRRGGTDLPFNGRIYSLVVRGAATDATRIAKIEKYIGGKMGIAL